MRRKKIKYKFYIKLNISTEFAEELPIFYANRSAALYYLKKYDVCINDIDFALKTGYPSQLTFKLADRYNR